MHLVGFIIRKRDKVTAYWRKLRNEELHSRMLKRYDFMRERIKLICETIHPGTRRVHYKKGQEPCPALPTTAPRDPTNNPEKTKHSSVPIR